MLNKQTREKVEKAFLICYTKSNFDSIKDYTSQLDDVTMLNLCSKIPELKPPTPPEASKEENEKIEASPVRGAHLQKDRLRNVRAK